MQNILTTSIFIALTFQFACCQNTSTSSSGSTMLYHINENVKNSNEDYFVEIFSIWRAYLNSNYFVRTDSEYWNYDEYEYPDFGYVSLLMDLRKKMYYGKYIQCSIAGIVPVKNDYYLLKSIFTERKDSSDLVNVNFIISVYAKKNKDKYEFYSSTQYYKELFKNRKIGDINYIVHPDHNFDSGAAKRMEKANIEIAQKFEMPPLKFEYVVANDTRDLSNITGVNLFEYSYQPVASGGMADVYNNIIYAGNNSEYYPHEVVHLYTNTKFPRQSHHWFDEGIAALIGGSSGYDIEWHWEKLRRFIEENLEYKMDSLSELQTLIPNGEFITDFRYAIGALICYKIIEKEGMKGIFDALQSGRSEDNYFDVIKEKLNVNQEDFGKYVKTQILSIPPITDKELKSYKY